MPSSINLYFLLYMIRSLSIWQLGLSLLTFNPSYLAILNSNSYKVFLFLHHLTRYLIISATFFQRAKKSLNLFHFSFWNMALSIMPMLASHTMLSDKKQKKAQTYQVYERTIKVREVLFLDAQYSSIFLSYSMNLRNLKILRADEIFSTILSLTSTETISPTHKLYE